MAICGSKIGVPCEQQNTCPDNSGCPKGMCPDFEIRRHDTKPALKISLSDCNGPMDLTEDNLVLEVNMWSKAKLKTAITEEETYFALADNIGFDQMMVGDIIIMDRTRLPEQMLVIGFDENNSLVQVQRGYNATTASEWKKGTKMRIFRILNGIASIESVLEDILQPDGTTKEDQLTDTFLVHEWEAEETCTPGCYWVEFKLLKMSEEVGELSMSSTSISFTPSNWTPSNFNCSLGDGVEWVRRFPSAGEGFLIKIYDSPTAE